MAMKDDARLIEIESKITFQEDLISQLNDVVIEQAKRIDALERRCLALQKNLKQMAEGDEEIVDLPPPHY